MSFRSNEFAASGPGPLIPDFREMSNLDYSLRYDEHSLALDDSSTNESINSSLIIILACRA